MGPTQPLSFFEPIRSSSTLASVNELETNITKRGPCNARARPSRWLAVFWKDALEQYYVRDKSGHDSKQFGRKVVLGGN